MNAFVSKSSLFVKIVTTGTLVVLLMVLVSLMVSGTRYGMVGSVILVAFTAGTALYFYANSLHKVIIDDGVLILKKVHGEIKIPGKSITGIAKVKYSNLTMTHGSKGVFGFVGTTMDDFQSLVKDRGRMVKIETDHQKYVISVDEPDRLTAEIERMASLT